jgi:hypothetical protein
LIERISVAPLAPGIFIARARRRMRDEVDTLFGARPKVAGVLRAMLLGDRTFVDRDEATDFQKTGGRGLISLLGTGRAGGVRVL